MPAKCRRDMQNISHRDVNVIYNEPLKYSNLQAILSSKSFSPSFEKCLKIKTKKTYKSIFPQDMKIFSMS